MKIKINSMDTESTPSDDEIRSFMNFDKVVEEARRQSGKRTARKYWIIAPLALALFSVWYVVRNDSQSAEQIRTTSITGGDHSRPENEQTVSMPGKSNGSTTANMDNTTNMDSTSSWGGLEDDKKRKPSVVRLREEKKLTQGRAEKQASQSSAAKDKTGVKDEILPRSDVYVQAEPRHGYTQLYAYFSTNLSYPKAAMKDSIEGVEVVSFTIDEQGRPVNVGVSQSLGKLFDEEAVRLIREMPPWIPATLNDRPVASQLSLPLTFQITRIKKQ